MSVDEKSVRNARSVQAKHEAPTAIALAGTVTLVLFAADLLVRDGQVGTIDAFHAVTMGVFAAAWLLARSPSVSALVVPWIMSALGGTVLGLLMAMARVDETPVALAYVLMVIVAYSPFVLDPLALVASEVPVFVGFVLVVPQVVDVDLGQWYVAGFAALLIGWAVQRLRLRGIDALARATEQVRELATRDALTGVLNRQGLQEQLAGLVSGATRRDEDVFVVFVDVDGLKRANDARGHDFGDRVIVEVAEALRSTVRANDLVVRWGGDEFLVVGAGASQSQEVWQERLNARLAGFAGPPGWSMSVSVGVAESAATGFDLDTLTRAADHQMYDLRRERRGPHRTDTTA